MWRRPLTTLAILFGVLSLPLFLATPPVASAERPLAVLVVGDQNGAILTRREKELFRLLSSMRARAGLSKAELPIISYHFDKTDERSYCEKGLTIKRTNLLFVGLVEHEKRVPQKVVYRLNNVVDVDAAADKVMAEVVARMGLDPAVLLEKAPPSGAPSGAPSAAPSQMPSGAPSQMPSGVPSQMPSGVPSATPSPVRAPSPSPSPAVAAPSPVPTPYAIPPSLLTHPRPSPSPKPMGVTLLKLVAVDYQGTPQRRFLTTDRGVYVNAFLHNDNPTIDQRHVLTVRLVDPTGEPYGRPMGGAFGLVVGERIDQADMVRRSDPDRHNGYLIKGNALAQKTGVYKIYLEVDGQIIGTAQFEIAPGD